MLNCTPEHLYHGSKRDEYFIPQTTATALSSSLKDDELFVYFQILLNEDKFLLFSVNSVVFSFHQSVGFTASIAFCNLKLTVNVLKFRTL